MSPALLAIYRRLAWSRLASLGLYWRLKSWEEQQGKGAQGGDGDFATHVEFAGYDHALRHPALAFDAKGWEATREAFLDNFEQNLRTMVAKARSAGIRVVLCTMPFRYKLSPAWKHPQPLAYDRANREKVAALLSRAASTLERGDYAAAIADIDQALTLEPKAPVSRYMKAYALEQTGKPNEAERWYGRARDAMVGNLGAVGSINDRIRRVAREEGVELADLKVEFDRYQHTMGGYFNRDLIGDDCHPNQEGQRVIADVLGRLLR